MLPLTFSSLAAVLALGLALAGIAAPALYKPISPDRLMPGTLSQDIVSLAVALPLLVLSRRLAHQGPPRTWLAWLGLLGYTAYAFGLYAFEAVVYPLYLGYIGAFSLSVWAMFAFFAGPTAPRPAHATAALFVLLSALVLLLWLSILIPAMQTRTPPQGATIFVFDLALVLPAFTATAVLLWRGLPWGDVLALPLLMKAATMGLSVLIGTLIALAWGQTVAAGEVVTYAAFAYLPAALLWPWWRALAA